MTKKHQVEPYLLQLGDVFICPAFADLNCTYTSNASPPVANKKHLTVNGPPAIGWWAVGGREQETDLRAHDETRAQAEFVVERTDLSGGGVSKMDYWPDGWTVFARRLRSDGTYDPEAETVSFHQSGSFLDNLKDPYTITRRMRMTFIPEK